MSRPLTLLGGLSAGEFLQQYWQQKPLLIRGALPEFECPVNGDDLAGLALDEDVESRLVVEQRSGSPWQVRYGPFSAGVFASLPDSHWTLLVQGLDLWVPETAALLDEFDFLPRWRMDDIMASFAVSGGSVGPHFDNYDVFLLQAAGQRRWRVGQLCSRETPTLEDTELDILAQFQPQHDWTLQPGDMLYLPPRIAHWGVAVDDCITLSVGFRAPIVADMLGELAVEVAALGDEYYRDPPLRASMAKEEIDPAFIEQARALMLRVLEDDALLADWFARYMTQPKYPELEARTGERRVARLNGQVYENGEPLR